MNLDFDFQNVVTAEFGVGQDDGDDQTFAFVSVDGEVQGALREMSQATWGAMQEQASTLTRYEPSEKYAGCEYVYLPLTDQLAARMHDLHTANNLPTDGHALGQGDIDVLCLDHINDDGAAHRKETAQGTRWQTAYKWIIKNDYPPNVQVLCYNCNMKKEVVRRRNSRKSNTLHA